jgi:hypothetical protein
MIALRPGIRTKKARKIKSLLLSLKTKSAGCGVRTRVVGVQAQRSTAEVILTYRVAAGKSDSGPQRFKSSKIIKGSEKTR